MYGGSKKEASNFALGCIKRIFVYFFDLRPSEVERLNFKVERATNPEISTTGGEWFVSFAIDIDQDLDLCAKATSQVTFIQERDCFEHRNTEVTSEGRQILIAFLDARDHMACDEVFKERLHQVLDVPV